MDIREINAEIDRLEGGETTYKTCGKLATLYVVRDGLTAQEEPVKPVVPVRAERGYSYAIEPTSEFIKIFTESEPVRALSVLDEHMNAIKALYPKEYNAVIRKMRE